MPTIPNIQPDPLLPQYRYNVSAGRFIGSDGRFIPQSTIRNELDSVLDSISDRMVKLSQDLRTGKIDGRTFQMEGMSLIKQSHLAGAALEKGGWAQLSSADFGRVGAAVRQEYNYFRNMLNQLQTGEQRLDGTLDVRMKLYAQAGRGTYHELERDDRAEQGFDMEYNVLRGRDHCSASKSRPGCVDETRRGVVPIGTLTPVGDRTCLSNCRCEIRYVNSVTGDEL